MRFSGILLMVELNYDISDDVEKIISRLDGDVQSFHNKKILITGGTGFFGRWLLQILCTLIEDKKFRIEIFVVSRNPNKFLRKYNNYLFDKYLYFIEGDICDFRLPDLDIDYLIHMATTSAGETYSGEDQLKKIDVLYRGTKNTLNNSTRCNVKKVLFTSSGVVYGPPATDKFFLETDLIAPSTTNIGSALGEGKRLAEYLISYYAQNGKYDYSIARCFSFYGPFLPLDVHYAIGNFVYDALYSPEIIIKGNGEALRSYLYIGDAWVWLLKMLINADNEVFNVGSDIPISIKRLASVVGNTLSQDKNIKLLGLDFEAGNFKRNLYIPNSNKIKEEFGVLEWTNLESGLRKMSNHL